MKLQQLRYLVEVARQGLNVSVAADTLFTSQPGISKQIKLLEEEIGVAVFERTGKRLSTITEPGKVILEIAERMLRDAENIRRVGSEYAGGDSGGLVIATTHTQARYALPKVVKNFVDRHPQVRLSLRQGHPTQIAEWTVKGEADIAIATEALDHYPQLLMLPCYQWAHCIIAPEDHPIRAESPLSLAALARWPLITYDPAFAGRSRINRAFELAQLQPNVVLAAIDADVIKTYVGLGLGLGIIAAMAFDAQRDVGLRAINAAHLFGSNITHIGLRRGSYIRGYEYDFIELFAAHLTRKVVDTAMAGSRVDKEYQL
ncbi:MAG TPA: CysB family HTH-type transcriptional regulator [Accumulibacter sp.]|nr:CysB family HTH-type transcriptional regulator [Accumulibacter sp.]HMW17325.1 CysB family HTH-type transcriptional regulator [Accumulibacter sp.]HMX21725.1 CysB family HTH-type transcriptional regulator [Accumulibacter sp.]HMY06193.1 CysB family HTH-type transcriptional regulator [Accumulibacter sp.]HNC17502.1 CysB family HTH-type transcriptional regulator [Accumulibacter sp.]